MSTFIDLMLAIRRNRLIFYHKDTNKFDFYPYSEIEMKNFTPDAKVPVHDTNNFRLPSYDEINHKDIMRFFAKECVEDKGIRKQLFDILRRKEYMDAYLDKLHGLDLYNDFVDACGDVYIQIFEEWACENGLDFKEG